MAKVLHILIFLSVYLLLALLLYSPMIDAQSFPPLITEEGDASPTGVTTKLKFPNGTLSQSGTEFTYTPAGASLTIGDAITSGGAARILYEDDSNNLAESARFKWDTTDDELMLGGSTTSMTLGRFHYIDDALTYNWMYFQNTRSGTTASDGMYIALNGADQMVLWNFEAGTFKLGVANSTAFSCDSSGRCAQGSDTPSASFDVIQKSNQGLRVTGKASPGDDLLLVRKDNNDKVFYIEADYDTYLKNTTVKGSGFRIDRQTLVPDYTTTHATGDGKAYLFVGPRIAGSDLVYVHAQTITAGTVSGTLDIQIARCAAVSTGNVCSGTVTDMLSTKLTVDAGEDGSDHAATAAVINTANDDVTQNQVIRFDIDAVHGTAGAGLIVTTGWTRP